MPTVYDILKLLDHHGWRLSFQAKDFRQFRHHAKPGNVVTVSGRAETPVSPEFYQAILRDAGIPPYHGGDPS